MAALAEQKRPNLFEKTVNNEEKKIWREEDFSLKEGKNKPPFHRAYSQKGGLTLQEEKTTGKYSAKKTVLRFFRERRNQQGGMVETYPGLQKLSFFTERAEEDYIGKPTT